MKYFTNPYYNKLSENAQYYGDGKPVGKLQILGNMMRIN